MPLSTPSPFQILASSAVASSLTGTTAETVMVTVPIPARAMGLNSILRVSAVLSFPSSANLKTIRVRLGGLVGQQLSTAPYTTPTLVIFESSTASRGSSNSQYSICWGSRSTDTVLSLINSASTTVDTTVAQDLVITGALASAAEALTLQRYHVELVGST
jgi:hypothetical protein